MGGGVLRVGGGVLTADGGGAARLLAAGRGDRRQPTLLVAPALTAACRRCSWLPALSAAARRCSLRPALSAATRRCSSRPALPGATDAARHPSPPRCSPGAGAVRRRSSLPALSTATRRRSSLPVLSAATGRCLSRPALSAAGRRPSRPATATSVSPHSRTVAGAKYEVEGIGLRGVDWRSSSESDRRAAVQGVRRI